MIRRALTIAGSDSGGGAGIQADLKAFTNLGVFGTTVLTAITAQNTVGVKGIVALEPSFVAQQLDAVLSDIGTDAAKTGMLFSSAIIEVVAAKLKEYHVPNLVVDPVMVAKSGDFLLLEEARQALIQQIIPLASVVTPNLDEAQVLVGEPITDLDGMKRAAQAIHAMGTKSVLIKGGHLSGRADDLFYDGQDYVVLPAERINTKNSHGTGCTYSAAIAALLARGFGLREAVSRGKEYIHTAIAHSFDLGSGHGPTNHWAGADLDYLKTLR